MSCSSASWKRVKAWLKSFAARAEKARSSVESPWVGLGGREGGESARGAGLGFIRLRGGREGAGTYGVGKLRDKP